VRKYIGKFYMNDKLMLLLIGTGFVVTQTSSLVDMARQAKDDASGKTAQQGCYLNVPVSGVRTLCLSRDDLTLAACVGDRTVQIYDVPTLVHKVIFARSYVYVSIHVVGC
jgi:WD40 repeat protein